MFVCLYNDKLLLRKQEVITLINNYMTPVGCCQNNQYIFNYTSDDMISKFEAFTKYKLDKLDLTGRRITECLKMIYE